MVYVYLRTGSAEEYHSRFRVQNHRRGSKHQNMSEDENLADKTSRYESGVPTDESTELRNALSEICSRLDRLELSVKRNSYRESSPRRSLNLPRGRRETDLPNQANFTSVKDRILLGPSPQAQAAANGPEVDQIQEQFNAIKSYLERVVLPPPPPPPHINSMTLGLV